MSEVEATKKIEILGDEEVDLIASIEHSFDIELSADDCLSAITFGDLCRVVCSKMNVEDISDCTSQQAFYKLRAAIVKVGQIRVTSITPKTRFDSIFTKKERKRKFKQLESILGFPVNALAIPDWLILISTLAFLVSCIVLFVNWKFGIFSFLVWFVFNKSISSFDNTLYYKTIGELAESIARNNYMSIRRNPKTANKKEVLQKMRELFSEQTGMDIVDITPDAHFA